MYQQLVIKHIRCIPCNRLIDAKQFRTTETNKALQDERIEAKINSRHLPGFPTCPTCKKKVVIVDPPKPTPQAEKPIDREKAHRQYQALLKMESVLPESAGRYPSFVEFCALLQKRLVQYHWKGAKVKRIDMASKPLHLVYVLIKGDSE